MTNWDQKAYGISRIKSFWLILGTLITAVASTVRADVLEHWTTHQVATNFYLTHVVYGNGVFVASAEFGDSGAFFTSSDGSNWIQSFSDLNSWGMKVNYSEGQFSAVGGFGTVNVSSDGINWTSTFLVPDGSPWGPQAITFGDWLFVTVGDMDGVGSIQTSPDGVIWTSIALSPVPAGRINSVAYGGDTYSGTFVAIGNNDGLVYTSAGVDAGTTWTQGTIPGGSLVSYAGGLFFIPLTHQTNLISADGYNWSLQATGLTNTLGSVNLVDGVFMAQCGMSSTGGYLATSTDGTNWIQYSQPLPNFMWVYDTLDNDATVATDGNRLVGVGEAMTDSWPLSYAYVSDVLVGIRMTNLPPSSVVLSGLIGRQYQIQSANVPKPGGNKWNTSATMTLPSNPFYWTDPAATNAARFYRGVLLP
jgi:hypothetical protein